MNHIWIVEVRFDGHTAWHSTVGAAMTKKEGAEELQEWKIRYPDDSVRLVKYETTRKPK